MGAKEKLEDGTHKGAIVFIDELDAIGTKRFGGEQSGDREVQRTMLELLSQLDGFSSNQNVKVIAATNPRMCWTPRYFAPAASTGRLSCLTRLRKPARASCRSTRARWRWIWRTSTLTSL